MQQILSSATDRSKLFYLFFFAFVGLFLSASLTGLIFGGESANAHDISEIRLSSFLQASLSFLLPAYTVFAWGYPKPVRSLKLSASSRMWTNVAWGIVILWVAYPFTAFLTQFNKEMVLPESMVAFERWMRDYEREAAAITDILLSDASLSGLILNLVLVAGFAALAEEVFFRGALQQLLRGVLNNGHLAVWVGAFIFSAVHLQFYGFLPRLVLGAMLGYLFYYSGNLWVSIAVHFLNNAVVIATMYYRNFAPAAVDRIANQPITAAFAMAAAGSAILTIVIFRRYGRKNRGRNVFINEGGKVL